VTHRQTENIAKLRIFVEMYSSAGVERTDDLFDLSLT